MPVPQQSIFTEYAFNQLEFYAATRLNELNKMLIQTLLSKDAQEKSTLIVDPKDIHSFIQREAELQGAMRAYQHLLWLAENTPVPEGDVQNEAAQIIRSSNEGQPT